MKRLLTYFCILAGIAIAGIVINSCSDNTSDPTGNAFTGTLEYEDGSPAINALVVAGNLDFETIYYIDNLYSLSSA